jgi:hypothetical protein
MPKPDYVFGTGLRTEEKNPAEAGLSLEKGRVGLLDELVPTTAE